MFKTINKAYNKARANIRANRFIIESTLDVEETLPGSDEEIEALVDPDSVPDEVYARVDAMLEKIVNSDDYDDADAEELADDDFDDDEIDEGVLDELLEEAVSVWYDDESIGRTNTGVKSSYNSKDHHQPRFKGYGQNSLGSSEN